MYALIFFIVLFPVSFQAAETSGFSSSDFFNQLTDLVEPCDLAVIEHTQFDSATHQLTQDLSPNRQLPQLDRIQRLSRSIANSQGIAFTSSLWNQVKAAVPGHLCRLRADGIVGQCVPIGSIQYRDSDKSNPREVDFVNLNAESMSEISG